MLNIRVVVPPDVETFQIGIFDGDHLNGAGGEFHWDTGNPLIPGTYLYSLKADPDRDNNGQQIFAVIDTDLLNNDWVDFEIENSPLALDADGNYVYTFSITLTNNVSSSNVFKIRLSEGQLEIDEIFTFIANASSAFDLPIIYPNIDGTDITNPANLTPTTYDGTFTFFFNIAEPAVELVFWDGDADHGNFDGTSEDTDDQNTPNVIPAFAPPAADTLAEGVNIANPFDDTDPDGASGTNILFLRSPAVTYKIIFPDGQEFSSTNPSGNREWENLVLSTLSSDPNIVDFTPTSIPAGDYEIRFEGLDMGNFVSVNPLFPLVLRGEVIEDDITKEVPTISEWGLIVVAIAMAIVGVLTVRRRQQVS